MAGIISVIISSICTVAVAIIGALAQKSQAANDAYHKEERAARQLREKESRLSMSMMDATLQLSIVTANALTGGKNNGNVEEAKKAAEKAKADYDAFIRETAANALMSH